MIDVNDSAEYRQGWRAGMNEAQRRLTLAVVGVLLTAVLVAAVWSLVKWCGA